MNIYWSDVVKGLDPYVPGEQPKLHNLIKLNTNENPYGPSPRVAQALSSLDTDSLRLYPDPNADALRQTIADYFALAPNQVFLGNGSDEVLAHVFNALLKHEEPLLFPDISYSFYPVYCKLFDIQYATVALDAQLAININDYQRPNGGIIFPNPNAPTGNAITLAAIEQLLQHNTQSVVVVDEAYVDFGAQSAVSLVNRYPNVLVVQTLSKSRSLAGLRVGYAMGNAELIDALERVKNSFNSYPLDRYAQIGAIEAFNDEAYFRETCAKVVASRADVVENLQRLGFSVLPSSANFVFASHASLAAADIMAQLRSRNIIVRYFDKPRINNYLRITIGTPSQCSALISALADIVS